MLTAYTIALAVICAAPSAIVIWIFIRLTGDAPHDTELDCAADADPISSHQATK